MPAAYPINSFQPIVPFDGPPSDNSIGMLGQIGVDVNSGAYYQKILGKWYAFGDGPYNPVLTTLNGQPTVDGAAPDGTTMNNVTFTAQDQKGNPMQVNLNISLDSSTAYTATQTTSTNSTTGQATVSLTDTVAEVVTVTATAADGSGKTATASSTFAASGRIGNSG